MNSPTRLSFRNIYFLDFFLSFHLFIVLYVNSSFLSTFFSTQIVSVLYFLASVAGLLGIIFLPRLLKRIHLIRWLLMLSVFETVLFVGLGTVQIPLLLALLFIGTQITFITLTYGLDLLLENAMTSENTTGNKRGILLMTMNSALILCPLVVGWLVVNSEYRIVYILSALVMIPVSLMIGFGFQHFSDPVYKALSFRNSFHHVINNTALKSVYAAQLLLRIFFAFMVIYTPLYLHDTIGFSWSTLGIILSVAILPFILFELPAGKLADTRFGEKEMMVIGFALMCLMMVLFSFVTSKSAIVWGSMMFLSRMGASLVEITTESYFFKHVTGLDSSVISFFRASHPISNMIAPLMAGILLIAVDIQYIFIALALLLVFGMMIALQIKDTR